MELNDYQKGVLTSIYGPPASGKTTLCLKVAGEFAKVNKKVIFVDTENSFSLERLKQMFPEYFNQIIKNIIRIKIDNLDHQLQILEKLKQTNNIDIVIIDSLSFYYRKELKENTKLTNEKIVQIFRELIHIAKDHNIPVISTNQIYNKMETNEIMPVGGNLLKKMSKVLIKLECNPCRKLYLEKHPNIECKEVYFKIINSGLELSQNLNKTE